MQYVEVTPHPTLSNYIDAYWTATGSSTNQYVEKILPDGCVDIIFNLGNDCYTDNGNFLMRSEKAFLVETMTRYKETVMDSNTSLLGVRFKPGGVSAFFKFVPLKEITNQTIEIKNLADFDLRKLSKSPFDVLNQVLEKNLKKPNLYLLAQIQTIKKSMGQIKIEELASLHCTTVRQVERNFKEHLGVTPKEFVNLVRYQNAQKAIEQRESNQSILSIAFDFGYYDHSHLANDFRRYTGSTPTSI